MGGRERGRGGRDGGRDGGRERGRGKREGGREEGREGEKENHGRERRREEGREGGREKEERKGGREGGRDIETAIFRTLWSDIYTIQSNSTNTRRFNCCIYLQSSSVVSIRNKVTQLAVTIYRLSDRGMRRCQGIQDTR